MQNFPAGDVPMSESVKLKRFAHELAGTLVFDLGVDVSSSMYTLGQTSSWIGHHVQPLLGNPLAPYALSKHQHSPLAHTNIPS